MHESGSWWRKWEALSDDSDLRVKMVLEVSEIYYDYDGVSERFFEGIYNEIYSTSDWLENIFVNVQIHQETFLPPSAYKSHQLNLFSIIARRDKWKLGEAFERTLKSCRKNRNCAQVTSKRFKTLKIFQNFLIFF